MLQQAVVAAAADDERVVRAARVADLEDETRIVIEVAGKIGFRFFGELILYCLNRTEKSMTQAHAFKAAELCIRAQDAARRLT